MFRNVPGCSGMFHVPDFIDAREKVLKVLKMLNSAPNSKKCSKGAQRNRERPNTNCFGQFLSAYFCSEKFST